MSNLTASHKDQTMTNKTPLPLRNDTILGVCEAIGQDFGFNPIWLRLAFIAPLFFAPTAAIAAYLGLGVVVGLTNWFAPDKHNEAPHLVSSHEVTEVECRGGRACRSPLEHSPSDRVAAIQSRRRSANPAGVPAARRVSTYRMTALWSLSTVFRPRRPSDALRPKMSQFEPFLNLAHQKMKRS